MTNEDRAYEFLKDAIISGKYQPGHVLSETQMGIRLDMSRTPIREAFKKLENEGLIERKGQETRVTKVDLTELKDNYDLRSMLESYALKQNFPYLDPKHLTSFNTKFDELMHNQDWTEYLQTDKEFHTYLTNNTEKATLQKCLNLLQSQTNRMRFAIRDDQHCIRSSITEIKAIIAAILEGNQDEAVKALQTHIENVYEWEAAYLKQHLDK